MSTTVNHIPTSAEDFTTQLEFLLAGLEGRDPDELSYEVIGKHVLDASDDKVEIERITDRSTMAQTTFTMERRITITKKGASQPSFEGTTNDQWSGLSTGALLSIINPEAAHFVALDGIKLPYVPLVKFLVIFFYNIQGKKSMVFVGKAIYRDLTYTTGDGWFQGF